jgi:uncharacterized Tic20 family protein
VPHRGPGLVPGSFLSGNGSSIRAHPGAFVAREAASVANRVAWPGGVPIIVGTGILPVEKTMNANLETPLTAASDRHWAAAAPIAALVAAALTNWFAGVAGALAALAVWMLVRDRSAFASAHAREAANFNLSMFLYACAAGAIGIVLVGATVLTLGIGALVTIPAGIVLLLAFAAIALAWLVCSLVAAVKAWDGKAYRYPLTMRLLG